jgi:hypothetical protein
MSDSWMEYPEVTGKTVDHLRYYTDPSGTRELHVRFTDGESLSIKLQPAVMMESELYRGAEHGDIEILHRYTSS